MRQFKATLAYDGTDFHGWQIQPDHPTVQGALKQVLETIECGPVDVQGAGRTDAGVHALGQVASFSLVNPIPEENLVKAVNRLLLKTVRVLAINSVSPDFHARYSATGKLYEYRIQRDEICSPFDGRYAYHHPYPLDEAAMIEAAAAFEGRQDFRSLAASGGDEVESTVRTIFSSTLHREREGEAERLIYRVRGDGFLYHMVRNIVGTLLDVGRGRLAAEDIPKMLARRERAAAGGTAPARGLFLVRVEYGPAADTTHTTTTP
ncbi:MAG: tRNA pseudouridine(38-40) synthase TruA [Acidobacteria bacterium]|nr:tRNA pseudouridine(38-40) synthase TruA [Acidobacteriota bacterium]